MPQRSHICLPSSRWSSLAERFPFADKLLSAKGKRSANELHRELGRQMWDRCGMARNEKGLKELLQAIPELRERFWKDVKVTGAGEDFNQALERAGRVADYMEFGEL